MDAKERLYGEFVFDEGPIRRYWYVLGLLKFLLLSVVTLGVFLPVLAAWAILGHAWITLIFRRLRYEVDEDSLNLYEGVLVLSEKVIPLEKITDMKLVQGLLARCFGVWSVNVQTAGGGAVCNGVALPEATMYFESHRRAVAVREKVMSARRILMANPLVSARSDD